MGPGISVNAIGPAAAMTGMALRAPARNTLLPIHVKPNAAALPHCAHAQSAPRQEF